MTEISPASDRSATGGAPSGTSSIEAPGTDGDAPVTEIEVEVRYAETDQMGVVHHSNYLVWFELARTAHCSRSGRHYADIEAGGHLILVTGVELSYRRGARYGDRVTVACRLERCASRGLEFAYTVRRGEEILTTGRTRHVWVDAATGRPCRCPESLAEPFRRLAGIA